MRFSPDAVRDGRSDVLSVVEGWRQARLSCVEGGDKFVWSCLEGGGQALAWSCLRGWRRGRCSPSQSLRDRTGSPSSRGCKAAAWYGKTGLVGGIQSAGDGVGPACRRCAGRAQPDPDPVGVRCQIGSNQRKSAERIVFGMSRQIGRAIHRRAVPRPLGEVSRA